ncbi:Dbl homology domain-containing protein [Clavulina sp. PMI_390]|nr:Dbl homology domain-containing protein [Clavulina sp. PMI_390]
MLSEASYLKDLELINTLFVDQLKQAQPPIISPYEIDTFVDTVFGNILDLRMMHMGILDKLNDRRRSQGAFIELIGDIFWNAAREFRMFYPQYVANLFRASQRAQEELDMNTQFKIFHEKCQTVPEVRGMSLQQLILLPSEHLQQYPTLLETIWDEWGEANNDAEYLIEASEAIRKLSKLAELKAFQVCILRGDPPGDKQWAMLVADKMRDGLPKGEAKRQQAIFGIIRSEAEYVRDLEVFQKTFIWPLGVASPPLANALDTESSPLLSVLCAYEDIIKLHKRLVYAFFEIQSQQHPCIESIIPPIADVVLDWRDAYTKYAHLLPIFENTITNASSSPNFEAVLHVSKPIMLQVQELHLRI